MSNNKRRFFLRYISILQKLRTQDASFDEISDYLQQISKNTGNDLSVSQRTFQRDINDINDIFNIEILANSMDKYYIADGGDPMRQKRTLETFDQLDLLYRAKTPSRYVFFEKREASGSENIPGVLHAIYKREPTNFKYEKYWEDSFSYRTVEPLVLKECQNRWYMIACDRKDGKIKTFGLDRVSEMTFEKEKFEYPNDFDADQIFKDSFGIISEGKVEELILSFDVDQKRYLGSLKLHDSQEVLIDDEDEYRIRLYIKITHDLKMEIMSYGDAVEVLSPKSLRSEMKKRYSRALKYYSKN